MIQKAAASAADHVFLDLEDSVAPSAKAGGTRQGLLGAHPSRLGTKDSLRARQRRHHRVVPMGDIIEVVEKAGTHLDTIMLAKPYTAADVSSWTGCSTSSKRSSSSSAVSGSRFVDRGGAGSAERRGHRRLFGSGGELIFGLGDYSASQGIELEQITSGHYPGDLFHYARFRIAMRHGRPELTHRVAVRRHQE